jgi:hypothetical protein
MDEKTGEILTKEEFSSIQFYLDKMSYNSFYINPLSKNSEFSSILTKALSSSNNSANKLAKHIQR